MIELVNDAYRDKDELLRTPEGQSQLRFATATAGSLIFPFAPAPRLGGLRAVDRPARVGGRRGPRRTSRCSTTDMNEVVVQVNGKLRDRVGVPAGASEDEHVRLARESAKVSAHFDGRPVVKTIVVPGKLVNFVLG